MLKVFLSAIVLLAGAALLAAPAAAQERRMALVIGNGAYQNTAKLPNPARDANAVADMFRKAGFEVVEAKTDLTIQEFKRVTRDFTQQTRNADIAVIFYAGHGIEIGGQNYLIPVDAKLRSDYDAEDEALTLDRIVRAVEPARKFRLIILDACRDNPFLKGMARTASTRSITNGLGKVEPTIGDTLIAYAAKGGSVAEDGEGMHSPFTTALLKHLAEPGLDVRLAFGRIRDDVMRATGNKQEPFVYGSLGGSNISIVPPKKVEPIADARPDYEFAERIGTKDAWDLFLKHHPTGFYSDLARAQRNKFQTAAVAPIVPPPPVADGRTALDEVRAWEKIRDSGDAKLLREFIQRFPNSTLAVLAQRRLEVIESAEREREAARQREEETKRAKATAEEEARRARIAAEEEAKRARIAAEEEAKRAKAAAEEEARRVRAAAEEQRRLEREAKAREEEARRARAAAEAKQREDDARTARAKAEEQKRLEREARQLEDEAKRARAAAEAKQREEEQRAAKAAADEEARRVKAAADEQRRLEREARQAEEEEKRKAAAAKEPVKEPAKEPVREAAEPAQSKEKKAAEREKPAKPARAAREQPKAAAREAPAREAPARAATRPAPAPARAPVQVGRGGGGGATMTGVGF